MRRWMIVLMVASLFVAIAATPGSADKKDLPADVEFLSGEVSYGAVVARTGEPAGGPMPFPIMGVTGWTYLMDPDYNKCDVKWAELHWIDKNTAKLTTKEDCSGRWPGGDPLKAKLPPWPDADGWVWHHKIVHITNGGAVKMSPDEAFSTFWRNIPAMTGCGVNGTFPIYHGHFDGDRLYATAHYHGPCDGGSLEGKGWKMFGIGLDDGPIHVTYTFDLSVEPPN